MPRKPLGSVRRTQIVTTYGPGALIAAEDESFMVAGLDRWQPTEQISERRLQARLHGRELYLPPAGTEEGFGARPGRLPVIRFPQMYSCQSCRNLDRFWVLSDGDRMVCRTCEEPLVPSRFVVACEAGHIDEFPYSRWVHRGTATGEGHRLRLVSSGVSAALRDIVLECLCGLRRSLDGAFNRQELAEVARCQGKRPWLGDQVDCGGALRTLQRGASNVWFSSVLSAISIPPWSEGVFQVLGSQWPTLKSIEDPAMLRLVLKGLGAPLLARGHDLDELVQAVLARQADEGDSATTGDAELRSQEYRAIIAGRGETDKDQQFVAVPSTAPESISSFIDTVVLVTRLREVRALQGFTRLRPSAGGGDDESTSTLAPLSKADDGWLPAVEVRGEGVFLRLDPNRLAVWETRAEVVERVDVLARQHKTWADRVGLTDPEPVTPRLVLLHTFAHAMIEQMALDGGYPSAALRERLYASEEGAGVLVYTATSDAAGSLGGIVAQGAPANLDGLVRETIERAAWCSSDPVCIETRVTGADGLNRAACHACLLVPETSCERMNVLLDRALLIGAPGRASVGFFTDLLEGD